MRNVQFATATGYVNEYAASGLGEYFAESVRAYVEVRRARGAALGDLKVDAANLQVERAE